MDADEIVYLGRYFLTLQDGSEVLVRCLCHPDYPDAQQLLAGGKALVEEVPKKPLTWIVGADELRPASKDEVDDYRWRDELRGVVRNAG